MKHSLRLHTVAIFVVAFCFLAGCSTRSDTSGGGDSKEVTASDTENSEENGNAEEGIATESNDTAEDNEIESDDTNDGIDDGKVSFEGAVVTPTDLPETEPIDVCSLSIDEMKDVLSSYSNFLVSDNFYADIPQKAQLFHYIKGTPMEEVDFKLAYDHFIEMFHYFFPDHDLDENYFYYSGKHSEQETDDDGNVIKEYELVKDHYDEIMAGEEADDDNGNILYLYDEKSDDGSRFAFEMPARFGLGYLEVGKGGTYELSGGESLSFPEYVFPYIGTYYPISDESFQLQDKEVRISDAVEFFESYVNSIPYPENPTMDVSVEEVDVLRVNEDTYGYLFQTTSRFRGVSFDRMRSGTSSSSLGNHHFFGGVGFMLRSDDIDVLSGYTRIQGAGPYESIDSVIDFQTAAGIVSERMSNHIDFVVNRVDLVYAQDYELDEKGRIVPGEAGKQYVYPCYRFTLSNTNDSKTYVCYVNAEDGENFNYYYVEHY